MGKIKIVLSGVSTNNKGAELMLYAILQEIERKWLEAEVYMPANTVNQGLSYIQTPLTLRYKPIEKYIRFIRNYHLNGILRTLHLPEVLDDVYAIKEADYFLDGSGLLFSDQQQSLVKQLYKWEHLLKSQKRQGTKVVFLPQAFGPIEKDYTKSAIRILDKYADIICPREKVSYQYLKDCGLVDMAKVHLFTDFTSLVEGKVPQRYNNLRGAVCIIPNERMVSKGAISLGAYKKLLVDMIRHVKQLGREVYLLNHEGMKDEKLAFKIKDELGFEIEVVSRLNALETKGLISTASFVISSRYHGVASALNSGIPCLATSWNHKYKELFSDYGLQNCILPLDAPDICCTMIEKFLNNAEIRQTIMQRIPSVKASTREMWEMIWSV